LYLSHLFHEAQEWCRQQNIEKKNTTEVKATYTDWNEQMMQKAQKPTASGQSTINS